MAKKSVYEIVTEKVLEKLKAGDLFWESMDLSKGRPFNYFSEKEYTGINLWLLDYGGQYATFKQITEAGGKIKEEESKNWKIVSFFAPTKKKKKDEKDEDEKESMYFVYRYYRVYDVVTQVEGLEPKEPISKTLYSKNIEDGLKKSPSKLADYFVENYLKENEIETTYTDDLFSTYSFESDTMSIMNKKNYDDESLYYLDLLVEISHSTGHEDRLHRKSMVKDGEYTDQELLTSKLISAHLMSELNLKTEKSDEEIKEEINYWIDALEKDSRLINFAGSQAYKGIDFLIGNSEKEDLDKK